jgi:hypothetical protein
MPSAWDLTAEACQEILLHGIGAFRPGEHRQDGFLLLQAQVTQGVALERRRPRFLPERGSLMQVGLSTGIDGPFPIQMPQHGQ